MDSIAKRKTRMKVRNIIMGMTRGEVEPWKDRLSDVSDRKK